MGVLLIGADKIKHIKSTLYEMGATKVVHFDCRKKNFHKKIPSDIDMVIFITEYLAHSKMESFKKEAKKRNILTVYSKYNKNELIKKIQTVMRM
ncbi:DUF2325 domain-containing protein [Nitratiruptor sp. SB155-2]|uniref:DUF2325 domain-containing protein n=1 Tax=Nitratiruptor sp. (strain SB155-2) TaxID=387092 RepID=UPI00015872D4|nr:DUF2325 domain-containing protein [Nitratiruptor sp. SB155-2]BAF70696.1 conserved hypothetical protein [Nitratiruptor sp. SB155-2]